MKGHWVAAMPITAAKRNDQSTNNFETKRCKSQQPKVAIRSQTGCADERKGRAEMCSERKWRHVVQKIFKFACAAARWLQRSASSIYRVIPPGERFGIAPTRLPVVAAAVVPYDPQRVPFAHPTDTATCPTRRGQDLIELRARGGRFLIMARFITPGTRESAARCGRQLCREPDSRHPWPESEKIFVRPAQR